MECANSAAVMNPFPSLSNILNSCFNCSSLYGDFSGNSSGDTSATNSENSTRPLLFVSAFWIRFSSWSGLGFSPSERKRDPSSSCVRLPSLFLSNERKISRSSAICSSSRSTGCLLLMLFNKISPLYM
ncbi:hypothetical protein CFOL_v3_23317 [Cephalotus follicularis]|uniref:Uncharacterized protein n=1 Tax=Cephalotus follicularis TaxID=3775 RepID=A0A1Q3CHW1_CEPFO|nr:hypothetical protein CFOL_v3_23317 [Cephalotus follicularis]